MTDDRSACIKVGAIVTEQSGNLLTDRVAVQNRHLALAAVDFVAASTRR